MTENEIGGKTRKGGFKGLKVRFGTGFIMHKE